MQGYCFKCKKKVEAENTKSITLKNGGPAMRGVCPVCGTIGKG